MKKSNYEIQSDSHDFVMFSSNCVCAHPSHCVTVIVEKTDDPHNPVEASLFFEVGDFEHDGAGFRTKLKRRLSLAWQILFHGTATMEDYFTFRDPEHLKDFRDALNEAVAQVEKAGNQ